MIDNRIIIKDKVYLLASDAAEAFGYDSDSGFIDDNKELIKHITGLPALISEEDFNYLLTYSSYECAGFLRRLTELGVLKAEGDRKARVYLLK